MKRIFKTYKPVITLIIFILSINPLYSKPFFVGLKNLNDTVIYNEKVTLIKSYPLLKLVLVEAENKNDILGGTFINEFKKKTFYSKKNDIDDGSTIGVKSEQGSIPWGIKMVNAEKSWELFKQRNSVKVMVFDTGIDKGQPAFESNLIEAKDFTDTRLTLGVPYKSYDVAGHGTHVSGTIAGNSSFLKGVIPWASLYMAKVCIFDCGSIKTFIDAFHWSIEEQVDVINMSLSIGDYPQELVDHVLSIIESHDIVIVASAGNNGRKENFSPKFPALMPTTLAVGAIDKDFSIASFSARGKEVDVVAPGVKVESASLKRGINATKTLKTFKSGTSMAAPHVTGIAALIKSHYPNMKAVQVREVIKKSSTKMEHMQDSHKYGSGLVNAVKALELASEYE